MATKDLGPLSLSFELISFFVFFLMYIFLIIMFMFYYFLLDDGHVFIPSMLKLSY